jgi:hypothetical protein
MVYKNSTFLFYVSYQAFISHYDPKDESWVLISLPLWVKTRLQTHAFDHLSHKSGKNSAAMQRMFQFSVNISWQTAITDPSGVCELMDCSATLFMN